MFEEENSVNVKHFVNFRNIYNLKTVYPSNILLKHFNYIVLSRHSVLYYFPDHNQTMHNV